MSQVSPLRVGFLLGSFLLACAAIGMGTANSASWPKVSEATIKKYLFPDGSENETRLQRWESDMVLDFYFSNGKIFMKELVKEMNERQILGERQVHLMPPPKAQTGNQLDKFNFALGVREDFYSLALDTEQQEHGQGAYASHAKRTGCFARPVVRGNLDQGVITAGKIMARKDLKKDKLKDCLLRGMLLSAGLQHTQDLAYDDQPMTEDERKEAFDVLQLLYHPKVRSGMTRAEFTEALRSEGLITQ